MAERAGEELSMPEYDDEQRTGVERIVGRDLDEATGRGKPLSSHASQYRRSPEAYLKSGVRPRWMERSPTSTWILEQFPA